MVYLIISCFAFKWEQGRGPFLSFPLFVMIICIFSRILMNMDQVNIAKKKEAKER